MPNQPKPRRTLSVLASFALAATCLSPPATALEFAQPIALSSLSGNSGTVFDGAAANDRSGSAIAPAGDLNGDGFDDILIGAPDADPGGGKAYGGTTYVVFGKAQPFGSDIDLASLDGSTGFTVLGAAAGDRSGGAVAAAGDVNGDGYDDMLIGAHGASPGGRSEAGASYVVFGRASFAATLDLSALDGSNGFRMDGIDPDDRSGQAVAGAGDVNGDGFADLIVGAPGADPAGIMNGGESYVVFGRGTAFPSAVALAGLDGATGFRLDGVGIGDLSGRSVAGGGDINGDGFADVLVGSYAANSFAGATYVVFGQAAGFAPALALSGLDGSTGFSLTGVSNYDYAGFATAAAGDVNGDGFDDILIGANHSDAGGDENAGTTYLVFGRAAAFPATLGLASLDGTTGVRFEGIDAHDLSGFAVAGGLDINTDGFDDLLIGAMGGDPNGHSAAGESYVVFGKAGPFGPAVNLGGLTGLTGVRLDGAADDDLSGRTVARAGDVDGDGFGDVLVGAPSGDPVGRAEAGRTYLLYGRRPDTPRVRIGASGDNTISGGSFGDTLQGRSGDDVLEGRLSGDRLVGGLGFDTASYRHAPGSVTVDMLAPGNNTAAAAGDTYESIEHIVGSPFHDILRGNGFANVLTGAKGPDTLTGNLGPDVFRFETLADSPPYARRDRITDFAAGSAATRIDRIDVSAIDADAALPGNQDFVFIGTAPFPPHVNGRLRIRQAGTSAIVEGDVTGDRVPDFQIELLNFTNIAGVTALDFVP